MLSFGLYDQIDYWMNERMNKCIIQWINVQLDERMNVHFKWMNKCFEWMNERYKWRNELMHHSKNECTTEWMYGYESERPNDWMN